MAGKQHTGVRECGDNGRSEGNNADDCSQDGRSSWNGNTRTSKSQYQIRSCSKQQEQSRQQHHYEAVKEERGLRAPHWNYRLRPVYCIVDGVKLSSRHRKSRTHECWSKEQAGRPAEEAHVQSVQRGRRLSADGTSDLAYTVQRDNSRRYTNVNIETQIKMSSLTIDICMGLQTICRSIARSQNTVHLGQSCLRQFTQRLSPPHRLLYLEGTSISSFVRWHVCVLG